MNYGCVTFEINTKSYFFRCMFVDDKYRFVGARGCYDYEKRRHLWMWVSPFHLYAIGIKKCLTGICDISCCVLTRSEFMSVLKFFLQNLWCTNTFWKEL